LEPVNEGNKHLVVPCTIRNANGTTFSTSSFIDSGATGRGFYDIEKAHERNLTIYKLKNPKRLFVADGSPSSAGDITHATDLTIEINGHTETMTFYFSSRQLTIHSKRVTQANTNSTRWYQETGGGQTSQKTVRSSQEIVTAVNAIKSRSYGIKELSNPCLCQSNDGVISPLIS